MAAAVATVVTAIFSKQIVESILAIAKWWRDGQLERLRRRALDEELDEKGHKWIIRRQDRRITELEKALEELYREHNTCREEYAALKAMYDHLLTRLATLEQKGTQ